MPVFLNVLLDLQVPAPPDSLIVPVDVVLSPQLIVHVCVSAVPASLKDALKETAAPALVVVPLDGLVIVTVGATLATVTVKLPDEDAPVESVTVTLTVYGVERSLTYLCAAVRAPAAAAENVVAAVPSPQLTETVYGPVPPEDEPRMSVGVAPSVELWAGPAVTARVAGFTRVITPLEVADAPALSVTFTVIVKVPAAV